MENDSLKNFAFAVKFLHDAGEGKGTKNEV